MTQNVDSEPPRSERAERATRIAAMLARWEREEVSNEPDWDLSDIQPLRLRERSDSLGADST